MVHWYIGIQWYNILYSGIYNCTMIEWYNGIQWYNGIYNGTLYSGKWYTVV